MAGLALLGIVANNLIDLRTTKAQKAKHGARIYTANLSSTTMALDVGWRR
jgi:hypothetical protein